MQDGVGGVLAAEQGPGQRQQDLGLVRAAGGRCRASGSEVDRAADGDRDDEEQHQGDDVAAVADGERVSGGVKYQLSNRLAATAVSTAGTHAADDADRHQHDQVDSSSSARRSVLIAA